MAHRFTISLPDDAYSLLEEDAKRNCRTLSEELTYMLRIHKGRYSNPDDRPITTTTITNRTEKRKEIL